MIFKIHKSTDYTVITNSIFKDYSLSYKAKGLLAQMLSLPEDWNWSAKGLTTLSSDGESSVKSAIAELEQAGYLVRSQQTNEKGQFSGYVYDVYETPLGENPLTEKSLSEKQPQLNNNIIKEINNNIIKGDDDFEKFWNMYDRKVARPHCERMWAKLTQAQKAEIFERLPAYIQATPDKQFRMHPATYINPANRRWQDEIINHSDNGTTNIDRGNNRPTANTIGNTQNNTGNAQVDNREREYGYFTF